MISLLQYVSSKIFNYNTSKKNDNNIDNIKLEEENVENLLTQIDEIRQNSITNPEIQFNLIDDEGCFYKIGIITLVHVNYILIEDKYMCETKYVIPTDLQKGDKVYYMAYKVNKDEKLKIRKIICKVDCSTWDVEINEKVFSKKFERCTNSNIINDKDYNLLNNQVLEKKTINKRIIVGKVDRRKGREIFLENNTCINLDDVSSEFVPFVGDWLKLECFVEVNDDNSNNGGEILEIQSILPLRQLNKLGKVTQYNNISNYGVIDETIIFSNSVCMPGYIPCQGDKVVVQSIESDQGIQQHWRALTVVPLKDVSEKFETSVIKNKTQLPSDEINELVKDKEHIDITNEIYVVLDAKSEKEVNVNIKNNGNLKQTIHKCMFLSKKSESQLSLIFPANNTEQHLRPSEEITYKFKCKAKFVGVSEELVVFKFNNFKIGRTFQIKVNNINPTKSILRELNIYEKNPEFPIIPQPHDDGMYIKGIRPYKTAKFITVRPVTWKIPDILWSTINKIITENKTHSEAEYILLEKVPFLQQSLNIQNYKQHFDYLLYLEEIAQILDMQKFTMTSATMHRNGEYLTLNVPGLTEKRPSLIIGDRAIASFNWNNTAGKKHYEGYIHKIKNSDIFLKFNQSFHENYFGEDCQIHFKGSTSVIQRCHTAVSLVVNRLGSEFLFPKKVVQKIPQYNFIEDESNDENNQQILSNLPKLNYIITSDNKLQKVEELLCRRKLTWINKKLNIYQKEAVTHILKGLARPLPYVIFGPPGTGKTITMCEAILQIFCTISESRILIATPSNSSANLIAERLLDSKQLKPGDLVRLVAHHYIDSESIPEKLIPYCATADLASEGSHSDVNIEDLRGFKTNLTLSVLCRHRLIIGTCSAVGILYNMGCKSGHFTHVFVDEAGQSTEPEIMIPLSLARANTTQVVLAGDPKQLGPINQSRLAAYFGLNESFLVRLLQQFPYQKDPEGFELSYDPRLVTKLLMNYRSLPDLLDLPNQLFYEAELIAEIDPEKSEEAELLNSLSNMLPKRIGNPPAIVFHSVQGRNMQDSDSPSWYNPEEATQVYIYLLDLYNHGLQPEDIGIITPYSKQVYRIKHLLAELEVDIPKVGSVEEFQGQERKVIILSTVRTAENKISEDLRHALGFVGSRERLNVAITRARTLLIIIGNPVLLQQDVYWRSILEYCSSRNSCVGYKWHVM